ncbi:MAG: L-carnitine dehydrogenase [Alphaproteobacteria bacterium MarineAlpha10_Bin1]|nr:MAG: L-carnitine dehydrogenase [Alphaproteobacteria bacterium MarineAlpha10_Bin1]
MNQKQVSRRIACIGVGNLGRAWAAIFARAGHEVALYDSAAGAVTAALPAIESTLAAMAEADLVGDTKAVMARIRPCETLAEALVGVDYIQESVIEDVEVKRSVFRMLDDQAPPGAVIASSVSSIPPSEFMANLKGGDRCIVAHPVNPPHLIPVVEVMLGPATSEETYESCCALLSGVGQVPVRLNKEIFGYVLNRLQFALINEALHLVDGGYVSAKDVDKIVKYGLGRRWAFMGPFETNHLNASGGIEEYYSKFQGAIGGIMKELFLEPHSLSPELISRLAKEMEQTTPVADVPVRQEWRDRQLMALTGHFGDMRPTQE